jgi:hypothetical protein
MGTAKQQSIKNQETRNAKDFLTKDRVLVQRFHSLRIWERFVQLGPG